MSRRHLRVPAPTPEMRRPWAATVSVAWGVALGGTFGCLLPYALGYWHLHTPAPWWTVAQVVGGILIAGGLAAIVWSFVEFAQAHGTPVPAASPPRLVVRGPYGYVRNPIYVGFLAVLGGQALLFGSRGLLEYSAISFCVSAAAVCFYEEPALARKFRADYVAYRRAVHAWIPRLSAWQPDASTLTGPLERRRHMRRRPRT